MARKAEELFEIRRPQRRFVIVVKLHDGARRIGRRAHAPRGHPTAVHAQSTVGEQVDEHTIIVGLGLLGARYVPRVVVVVDDLVRLREVALRELRVRVRAVQAFLVSVNHGLPVVLDGVPQRAADGDVGEINA